MFVRRCSELAPRFKIVFALIVRNVSRFRYSGVETASPTVYGIPRTDDHPYPSLPERTGGDSGTIGAFAACHNQGLLIVRVGTPSTIMAYTRSTNCPDCLPNAAFSLPTIWNSPELGRKHHGMVTKFGEISPSSQALDVVLVSLLLRAAIPRGGTSC